MMIKKKKREEGWREKIPNPGQIIGQVQECDTLRILFPFPYLFFPFFFIERGVEFWSSVSSLCTCNNNNNNSDSNIIHSSVQGDLGGCGFMTCFIRVVRREGRQEQPGRCGAKAKLFKSFFPLSLFGLVSVGHHHSHLSCIPFPLPLQQQQQLWCHTTMTNLNRFNCRLVVCVELNDDPSLSPF